MEVPFNIRLDEDAIAWSHSERERVGRPLVVCLHGGGGREEDWADWFPALPAGHVAAALRGPVSVGQRWAWVGQYHPTADGVPPLTAVARAVLAWLDRQHAGQISLVGWSQGGALAVHLMRQQPWRFDSVAVIAGFVWDCRPHAGVEARRPAVWYGMGGRDDVVPPDIARASRRWLSAHTTAFLEDLPNETHMLSDRFVGAAFRFIDAHGRKDDTNAV
jgi:phospholipase/carboxylesterase